MLPTIFSKHPFLRNPHAIAFLPHRFHGTALSSALLAGCSAPLQLTKEQANQIYEESYAEWSQYDPKMSRANNLSHILYVNDWEDQDTPPVEVNMAHPTEVLLSRAAVYGALSTVSTGGKGVGRPPT